MSQLGRISGPLLKANLLRQGVDLAFETDLLYLDVNNRRIGVNTATPTHELQVVGTTRTTNLEVIGTTAQLGNFTITDGVITYDGGDLTFNLPEGEALRTNKFTIDSIDIENNTISTNTSNANLEIRPSGSGIVDIQSGAVIGGDLTVQGSITSDGSIVLGDSSLDTLQLNAKIASDIIPAANNFYTLGSDPDSGGARFDNLWVNTLYADTLTTENLVVSGVNISALPGNIWYVSTVNGNDTFGGQHPNDPFKSVKYALTQATSGDTVYLYPGTYEEDFPLTVPVGVTVKGSGIRSTKIVPSTETSYNDAFLLNGETTVEDLTVADFYSGGNFYTVTSATAGSTIFNVGTAPFAHTYVSGGTITISSIEYAVTGATYDHTTGNVTVTHAGPDATGLTIFLSNLTFSCNGGERVFPDNGYAFRFATDFEVTSRSPYVRNITVLTKGSSVAALTNDPDDPLGFDAGDAGKGALVDGGYATASSQEASMLFHSATFITPGVDCISMTNGARVEWLNSFTYYANRGLYLYSSNDGFALGGNTRVKITNTTGIWDVGDTITYYDTDGTTVLAQGVVDSIDGDFYNIVGKSLGWETPTDRAGKTVTAYGNAQLSTTQKKFGTASLALDGTGDYISIPTQPDFNFGTGDFTIETWIYPTTSGTYRTIFDSRTSGADGSGLVIGITDANQLYFYWNFNYRIGPVGTIPINTQTHIALSRSSGSTRAFINGVQVGSTYVDSNDYPERTVRFGADPSGNYAFAGYMDEVRITKGLARYTANFTAPTAAFTSDTSTVLLLHFNGTNGSTSIVDDGVTTQDLRSSSGGTASIIDLADYSDFGAELRSIGSACVYGNYGAVGDGDGVIAYLIGQNLAYIGNGKASTNDSTTVIQANEVVESNRAKIYYTSVDHQGNFRVGDLFYVNQDTGEVQFSNSNIAVTGNISFTDGSNTTYIDATKIETGDFRISGNTIETLSQPMDVSSFGGTINFLNDVAITGDLDVMGNVTIGGNITIGDQTTDTISIDARVNSDIIPKLNDSYDLGSTLLRWRELFVNKLTTDNVQIVDNTITTLDSNSDLELSAAGTGKVVIENNDVEISQTLTVLGTTNLADTNITGTVNQTGDLNVLGSFVQNGNLTVQGTLTAASLDLNDIEIFDNNIRTKNSNQNLQLEAAGTGLIYVPANNVQLDQNLTVLGSITGSSIVNTGTVTTDIYTNSDIVIQNNTIATTTSNSDLELRANGAGNIVLNGPTEISSTLEVIGTSTLADVNQTGTLTLVGDLDHTGNITQTGDTTITGNFTVNTSITVGTNDLQISGTTIEKLSVGDLTITAPTGYKVVINDTAEVLNDLTVGGNITAATLTTTNLNVAAVQTDDILISGNQIRTTLSNSPLELDGNGTGGVLVNDNLVVQNDLTVNGTSNLGDIDIVGAVTISGTITQTGNFTITGDIDAAEVLTDTAELGLISISTNTITTTSATPLILTSSSPTQAVQIPDNNLEVTNDVIVTGNVTADNISFTNPISSVQANRILTDDIEIVDNYIRTTTTTDLILEAAGTGVISIPSNDLSVARTVNVSSTTNLTDLNVTGTITHVGNVTQTGLFTITNDIDVNGNLTVTGELNSDDIQIVNNLITTTVSNSNLELRASGTGIVIIPNTVEIAQDLTIAGTLTVDTMVVGGSLDADVISNGDIEIEGNVIRTTLSSSNLELIANGTGIIDIPLNSVSVGGDLTVAGTTTINGQVTITGDVVQTGNYQQTGDYTLTGNLSVTDSIAVTGDIVLDDISIIGNTIQTTLSNSDLELRAQGSGRVVVQSQLETLQDVTISGTVTAQTINVTGTITADVYTNNDIIINNNVIEALGTNNLELIASGTGIISVPSNNVEITNNLTVNGTTYLDDTSITGTLTHTGDVNQTGNINLTGTYDVTGNVTVSGYGNFAGNLQIDANQIGVATGNLTLTAADNILIPSNSVQMSADLTVNGDLSVTSLTLTTLNVSDVQTSDIEIFDNIIRTTTSNSNLELRANGTGQVIVPNNDVQIYNDLTVDGTTTLADTNITGTLDVTGDINQTGIVTQTGDYNVTGSVDISGIAEIADVQINNNQITSLSGLNLVLQASGSGIVYIPDNDVLIENDLIVNGTLTANNIVGTFISVNTNQVDTGNIIIQGNVISTSISNSDLEIRTSGTGNVIIQDANLEVNGDLIVNQDLTLNNTVINGTLTHTGTATHTGILNQTGDTTVNGNVSVTGTAEFADIRISGNVLETTLPGSDLILQSSNTGIISVPFNDAEISQNLTVSGDVSTTDLTVSNTVTSPIINVGSIQINGNVIATTTSNTNLELRANGTGSIEIESVLINDTTISTLSNNNITLAPNGTGIVDIQGTGAVRLPRGATSDRPAGAAGLIRYNTDNNLYEGYDGSNWRRLDGVYDLDGNTYITPETTPGANDNIITFYVDGSSKATLTTSAFTTANVDAGNINITGNTISTTNVNGDLVLAPNGTGSTVIGTFALRNNYITNTQTDAVTYFNQTGTGYFKIAGTNGFVIPVGTVGDRGSLVETGMMRYNTTDSRVEVYDGTTWVSAAGGSASGVTYSEAEALAITSALIFG